MSKTVYFGFGLADSMFNGNCVIERKALDIDQVKELVSAGVEPCLNPSHQATVQAMQEKFGLNVAIPAMAPRVVLNAGDSVIVMGVRGLIRLEGRHEYTEEEVAQATFQFSMYTVTE